MQGQWPDLRGLTCTALIAEEYWHEGQLCEPANVVWIGTVNGWHRLTIDCDIIFWSRSESEPKPHEMTEIGSEVTLKVLGFSGEVIDSVHGRSFVTGGVEVTVEFEANRTITFHHINDHTTYYSR